MANKDIFNKASAGIVSAGKKNRFNNAMKKCDLAAMLTKAGIDKTAFDNSNWK